jgi:hypothetical protein
VSLNTVERRRRAVFSNRELGRFGLEGLVGAYRLPGAAAGFPDRPLPTDEWDALLGAVQRQWIWRLLGAAVSDGALAATGEQRAAASEGAARAAINDMRVEMQLVRTSKLLEAAGIEHRVLKGATTALRAYGHPELRSFGDVDILVPGHAFATAAMVLEEAGGARRFREARRGFDGRFSKGASFTMPAGVAVDLHRTFVSGPYGFTVDLDGVWSRCDWVDVAGTSVPCLEIHDAAVHACMHAALGGWPPFLTSLRDVAEFLGSDRVDPRVLMARAAQWRVLAVVARAVTAARSVLGLGDLALSGWAMQEYRPRAWELRALAAYGEGRSYRRQALAAVPFVPGVRSKLSYTFGLAFPAAAYLDEREGSYLRRIARALGAGDSRSQGLGRTRPRWRKVTASEPGLRVTGPVMGGEGGPGRQRRTE